MDIKGRTFIVTGAGSGLGRASAEMLVEGGARVGLLDINREAGQDAAERLGTEARFIAADVTDATSVGWALAEVARNFGALAGVINCAGVVLAERLVGREGPHDLGRFERVIRVNLIGSFNVARLSAEAMKKSPAGPDGERGVIVLTASIAAYDGQIGQAAYAASKGGVVSLTLPIARELARDGIRAVAIAPGIFDTPMLAGLPEAARTSLGQQVPFPSRLGHPAEYAALARHILENRMLNGAVIRLDGAIRMAPR